MRLVGLASCLAVLVAACGYSVSYVETNAPPHRLASRNVSSVEVFTVSPPERPFVEVGLFEIEQQSELSGSSAEMVKRLRTEAAKVGCDAVLITGNTQRIQSATSMHHGSLTGAGRNTATYQGMSQHHVSVVKGQRAACIVYRDLDLVQQPQSPQDTPPAPPPVPTTQL